MSVNGGCEGCFYSQGDVCIFSATCQDFEYYKDLEEDEND